MTASAAEPVPGKSAHKPHDARPLLARRQLDVLREIANGATFAEAGARLFISQHTAEMHMYRACQKLGATGRGRAYAVAVALRLGLLGLDEIALPPSLEARSGARVSLESRAGLTGAPGAAGGPR